MKQLNLEVKSLLDKLYNFRGSGSVILLKINEEKFNAEQVRNTTATQKGEVSQKINELNKEEVILKEEGELFKDVLKSLKKDSFSLILDKLNVAFNPEELYSKVENNLPDILSSLVEDKNTALNNLNEIEKQMSDAITLIQELAIRNDEAIINQEKLNDYFALALQGKINVTRDTLIELLSKFDLSDDEQREAAKLLMFPEDGLFDYENEFKDSNKGGISFSDVFAEAKIDKDAPAVVIQKKISPESIVKEVVSEDSNQMGTITSVKEEPVSNVELPKVPESNDNVIDLSSIKVDVPTPSIQDKMEKAFDDKMSQISEEKMGTKNIDEPIIQNNPSEVVKNTIETHQKKEPTPVKDLLNNNNFNYLDFTDNDLTFIDQNVNEEVLEKNVKLVRDLGINNDIFVENIELFIDDELEEKMNTLLSVGKVPFDIYLNPNILIKYDADELKTSIESLRASGLDPKKVPLMAY